MPLSKICKMNSIYEKQKADPESVRLTRALIAIESTNPGKGETEVCNFISEYLKDSGAEIILDEVKDGRSNLIATLYPQKAASGEMLVFICHMDTVVAGSGWKRDPFTPTDESLEQDQVIYGRGACDMKSGLACGIAAFRQAAKVAAQGDVQLIRPVRLICTVDEEGDMTGIDHIIRKGYVKKEDFVLDLEPTDGMIQNAHKGRLWFEITVNGVTAHASQPEKGADANLAAADMIRWMADMIAGFEKHPNMGLNTITFGMIEGGYQPYVVPDRCCFSVDIRLVPPVTADYIKDQMDKYIQRVFEKNNKIQIEYRITGNRPFVEANADSRLLQKLSEAVLTVTGKSPQIKPFTGYTDTAVVASALDNRECMSYGPGNLAMAHKPDEYVKIEDIIRCHRVMNRLIEIMSYGDGV